MDGYMYVNGLVENMMGFAAIRKMWIHVDTVRINGFWGTTTMSLPEVTGNGQLARVQ